MGFSNISRTVLFALALINFSAIAKADFWTDDHHGHGHHGYGNTTPTPTTTGASESGFAGAPPACLDDNGNAIADDDAQVVQWKTSTQNQFLARAHVVGSIREVYANETGHAHFSITLDNAGDTLEVIYNLSFGALPALSPGMQVEACGDYITSNAPAGGYQASPDGAIIHWIHRSDSQKHQSGYVAINGVTYGLSSNGHGN